MPGGDDHIFDSITVQIGRIGDDLRMENVVGDFGIRYLMVPRPTQAGGIAQRRVFRRFAEFRPGQGAVAAIPARIANPRRVEQHDFRATVPLDQGVTAVDG